MRITIVGGTFDDHVGMPSGYIGRLVDAIGSALDTRGVKGYSVRIINGGGFDTLRDESLVDTDVLVWAPNVSNDKEKLVNALKSANPKMMLVITKNNIANKYSRLMLIARALKAKANLMIEFTKDGNLVEGTIFDPLGNVFCEHSANVGVVAETLINRLLDLQAFTRIPSKQIGPAVPHADEHQFYEIVRRYAEEFHLLIHAANQDRLLGNASFRCENGFPSYRKRGWIFVSRRNIDKRDISSTGFVAVNAASEDIVEYFGDAKPSVDTPIQVRLYNYYPGVRYMLHAHVYIEGAPETDSIVPCGAIEEFDEIVALYPDRSTTDFQVNLKGHGSLVLASSVEKLENIPYIRRL